METPVWRWLDVEANDPRPNVAIEEAIFRAAGRMGEGARATLRLWRNPPAVVIGCHQSARLEANLEACRRHATPIVRRFTGGGTVYNDPGNLNFTLCVPRESSALRSRVPELYDDFTVWLRRMLGSFGVEATLVKNRIESHGKKISGLAASVGRGVTLVHGTLLVATDLERLREHLEVSASQLEAAEAAGAGARRWVRSQPAIVTSLEVECPPGSCPPVIEVARRARRFVESTYGVRLERVRELDPAEAECLAVILDRRDELEREEVDHGFEQ